jgi:hypothetical protein
LIPIEAESFPRRADILNTLSSNWINGTAVDVQKAIAKSLLRLALNPTNAATFATATGLPAVKVGDKEVSLVTISQKQVDGQSLDDAENGLNGRFDLVLSALLDAAYQKADQRYRNNAKAWATVVSVALSLGGCYILGRSTQSDLVQAVLLGLIATPLAPLAKDLSTAVVAATQMIKSTKR